MVVGHLENLGVRQRSNILFGIMAAAVNVLLMIALTVSLRPSAVRPDREMIARIIEEAPAAQPVFSPPQLKEPELEVEPAPEVQVNPHPADAISVQLSSQILAPRPDPSHFNQPPLLPSATVAPASAGSLIARIHVLKDGTVDNANILNSSGNAGLDQIALAFIKEHWRFLPALANGVPVDDWTSVGVTFKASAG